MKHALPTDWKNMLNLFTLSVIALLILGIIPLSIYGKHDIVLAINKHIARPSLDDFFIAVSALALGWIYVVAVLVAGLYSYKKAAYIAAVGICTLILSPLFKFVIFHGFNRPTIEIPLQNFSYIIDDFKYARYNSFPSGHSMSAFALASAISLCIPNRYIHALLLLYALGVGFSRMYLLQHFYMDVYAGATIGLLTALICTKLSCIFSKIPEKGLLHK